MEQRKKNEEIPTGQIKSNQQFSETFAYELETESPSHLSFAFHNFTPLVNEKTYPTKREKEHHRLKSVLGRDM